MKLFQNKFIRSLPKVILFLITFYNFVWASWQNLQGCSGVSCPWFLTGEFHYPQFFLFLASLLFLIQRLWSYLLSMLISGYFAITWTSMIVKWFWTTDYSLAYRWKIITSQYFGHPLQIWESQCVIALMIFSFASFYVIQGITHKKITPLS